MTAYLISSYLNSPPPDICLSDGPGIARQGLVGSHSYSHTYVNSGAVGNVWGSSIDGITYE